MKKLLTVMLMLCCVLGLNVTALAFEGEKEMPKANIVGVVAQAEMDEALAGETKDNLYLRYSEDEIVVFNKLGKDNAACSQILFACPMDQIFEVYTNDKASYKKMYSVVRSRMIRENNGAGFTVVTDKSPVTKLDEKKAIYRFWFKKAKAVNVVNQHRGGFRLPIGIGIGIGHHRHGGISVGL